MNQCFNCGLPDSAVRGAGMFVKIRVKPENNFKRESTRTVWCHDEECAVQSIAVAKFGNATHKWPVTLAQFRSLKPLARLRESSKRVRASRKAKDLVWGTSEARATAKNGDSVSLESRA